MLEKSDCHKAGEIPHCRCSGMFYKHVLSLQYLTDKCDHSIKALFYCQELRQATFHINTFAHLLRETRRDVSSSVFSRQESVVKEGVCYADMSNWVGVQLALRKQQKTSKWFENDSLLSGNISTHDRPPLFLYSISLREEGGGTDEGFKISPASVGKKTRVVLTVDCGSLTE